MADTKRGRGRPALAPDEKLAVVVQCRMTPEERELCKQAAEREGSGVSEWMRDRLVRAAKRATKD